IVALNLDRCQVENDDCPRPDTSLARLAALPPVFAADGSVTAGHCCPLNDGAALLLVMSRRMARDCGFSQGLLFAAACSAGVDPNLLGLGPVPATQKLLRRQPGLAL
ncbi:acetyl-CoA C-acyltransferase, partial [Erwinia amylovora]|nr:acetyl-CoA C-acyltransferase [Erwinia amylovora]